MNLCTVPHYIVLFHSSTLWQNSTKTLLFSWAAQKEEFERQERAAALAAVPEAERVRNQLTKQLELLNEKLAQVRKWPLLD